MQDFSISNTRTEWALLPSDWMVLGVNATLACVVVVFAQHLDAPYTLLALHGCTVAFVFLSAWWHGRATGGVACFVHHWAPVAFILLGFFELGQIIPAVHPYGDYRFDHALRGIDQRFVGDAPLYLQNVRWKWLSDALMFSYLAYYPFAALLPAWFYLKGNKDAFNRVTPAILLAFVFCFVGYVLVPAVGPHKVFGAFDVENQGGYGLGALGYSWMRGVHQEPPDAFPSGHTLIAALVPILAWRYSRRLAVALAPIGIGMILATIYFRFHYVADLAASFALLPLCVWFANRDRAFSIARDGRVQSLRRARAPRRRLPSRYFRKDTRA